MLRITFEWYSLSEPPYRQHLEDYRQKRFEGGQCTVCLNAICSTNRSGSERGFEKGKRVDALCIYEHVQMFPDTIFTRHLVSKACTYYWHALHGNTLCEFYAGSMPK